MATTSISTSEAAAIAKRLRDLIPQDKLDKFQKGKPQGLEAGPEKMDAANWLEAIVGDRSNAVPEHVRYLEVVFDGLAKAVESIAATLSGVDSDNANGLSGVDSDASAVNALKGWVDTVNGTKPATLPPGLKTDYNSNDTGGNPQLSWSIEPNGRHSGDPESITIDIPDKDDLPNPDLFDEYAKIVDDINEKRGDDEMRAPGSLVTPNGHRINSSDPEN